MRGTEQGARRDARIITAAGLALLSFGIVLTPWGFMILSELPQIEEQARQLREASDLGGAGILPSNMAEVIAQITILGSAVFIWGAAAMALGAVLAILFGRVAFGSSFQA